MRCFARVPRHTSKGTQPVSFFSAIAAKRSQNRSFDNIDGNDANVLFTIEKKTGTLERIDVLKTFNTKRSPKVASPDGENAEAAKGFEVSTRSIADFERVWQEQFKPGIMLQKGLKTDLLTTNLVVLRKREGRNSYVISGYVKNDPHKVKELRDRCKLIEKGE